MLSDSLIEELTKEPCKGDYCFFKLIFKHCKVDQRIIVQIKCLEKFKYEKSEEAGEDIGRVDALMKWCDLGYAEAFDKIYNSDLKFSEIYEKVVKSVISQNASQH